MDSELYRLANSDDLTQVANLQIEHLRSGFGCVTLSLGVASTFPRSSTSKENLIAVADRALYEEAKDQGRDRVILDT
jgi:PleD family two-component response regulator